MSNKGWADAFSTQLLFLKLGRELSTPTWRAGRWAALCEPL